MEFNRIANFDPSSCISGKINRSKRIVSGVFRKHLKPYGITDSQLTLMFIMSKKEKMTQKQLSEFALLEKSSLNRNLTRLIVRKLLSREEFPLITITTDGKYFVENIIPIWEKAMCEIREIIGKEGEAALITLQNRLI